MTTGVENPTRATSHSPRPYADSLGPQCGTCRQTEARCAFLGECCPSCSHFTHLDAYGDEPTPFTRGRRHLPVEHGTDRGFHQHRTRRDTPCDPCRVAHSRTVAETCGAPTEQLNSSTVGIKGKPRQFTPGGGVA